MLEKKVLEELFSQWSSDKVIEIKEIKPTVHIISTDKGSKYILKQKSNLKNTEKEYKMLITLKSEGVLVSVPVLNKKGNYYIEINDEIFCLYPYIEGETSRESYIEGAEEYAKAYGGAIAVIHKGLKRCDFIKEYKENNFINEVFNWALPIIKEKTNKKYLEEIENGIKELDSFKKEYNNLPFQLIHRDMHPRNMIFRDKEIQGFLDFDISVKGVRIFDICYCGTGILMEGFDDLQKRDKWFKLLSYLVEGYESIEMLSDIERECMWYMMMCIQLICSAYFYKVNNNEAAEKNIEALIWINYKRNEIENSIHKSCIKLNMEEMGEFFNKRADGYDDHMRETVVDFQVYYKMLSQPIDETEDDISILDLGCGTGLELEGIFEKASNAYITGIDMSEDMMKKLIDRYKGFEKQIKLINGSYLQLPLGEEKYDYAVSSMTMHHFVPEEKLELYKNIRKAIKKGGIYIEGDYAVSDKNAKLLLERYYEIMESLDEDKKGLYHIDIPFSVKAQKELLLKAGFNDIEVIWRKGEAAIFAAHNTSGNTPLKSKI